MDANDKYRFKLDVAATVYEHGNTLASVEIKRTHVSQETIESHMEQIKKILSDLSEEFSSDSS